MTKNFYPVRVKAIKKTTADCALISLDIKEEWRDRFEFKHGQHLTLKARIKGEDIRRTYSLCSSPVDGDWKIAVKKVPQGRFSTFANEVLQVGDTLEVMPPNGRFFVATDPTASRHYVAFAAGSGITPIISIIKTHLQREPDSSFQLFYVNRTTAEIILREELEALKNQYLDRFELFHFLTREERHIPLFNGRITEEKLNLIFRTLIDRQATNEFFLCGPAAMIFMIRDYLQALGVSSQHIHFELFNTEGLPPKPAGQRLTHNGNGAIAHLQIIEGGRKFFLDIPRGTDSILDAALRQQADLPFACKGGVCCTCKAKLISGKVDMAVNYALEQDQLDEGYILTCQAVPLSEEVTVDFDA